MRIPGLILCAGLLWMPPAGASDGAARAPLSPIDTIDVARYAGRWYEVAKFPNWFQRRCISDTRAEYRVVADGRISVLNRCRNQAGDFDEASGEARQVGGASSPRLKVRFAPEWLAFLPFVWGDYWIVDLDSDYRLGAVSEPKREYLWILSRSPQPDPQQYAALLKRLQAKGLDVSRLELTRQLSTD